MMHLSKLNVVLLALLLGTLALHWGFRRDPTRPNYEFMPEMYRSIPYDAYAPNPNFSDDKTLRTPVPGTIARGHPPFHYAATPEDALRAGAELANPFTLLPGLDLVGGALAAAPVGPWPALPLLPAADPKAAGLDLPARYQQRGAEVFANNCQVCHGPAAKGDGPVTLRGVPAPPSLLADKALKMQDGQMFHILTCGQVNMPSYATQISREDRWLVILHVRSLQKKAAAKEEHQ